MKLQKYCSIQPDVSSGLGFLFLRSCALGNETFVQRQFHYDIQLFTLDHSELSDSDSYSLAQFCKLSGDKPGALL